MTVVSGLADAMQQVLRGQAALRDDVDKLTEGQRTLTEGLRTLAEEQRKLRVEVMARLDRLQDSH